MKNTYVQRSTLQEKIGLIDIKGAGGMGEAFRYQEAYETYQYVK